MVFNAWTLEVMKAVFGIGCKIFTIAGPVILFGVFTSWILGIILLIGKILGIV